MAISPRPTERREGVNGLSRDNWGHTSDVGGARARAPCPPPAGREKSAAMPLMPGTPTIRSAVRSATVLEYEADTSHVGYRQADFLLPGYFLAAR